MLNERLSATLSHFIRATISDGVEAEVKPRETEIARRVEAFIQGAQPGVQKRLRYLLLALWTAPVILHFKTFPRLRPEQQRRLIERWANSRFYYLWLSFDVLKSICMMVYYSDDDMEAHVQYRRPCGAGRRSPVA